MRKLLAFVILAVLPLSAVRADLVSGPQTSFLWNQFNSVAILDTFALATTDFGVALLRIDIETGVFSTDTTVLLANKAVSAKVVGDLAVVRTTSGIACIFDLSSLPNLNFVGQVDIGTTVTDAVLVGNDMYLACGFSGLRHYQLEGYDSLEFVDSSLAPVNCVQVEFEDPYLLVLDDYNGVIRYEPGVSGIGSVNSVIHVPRRIDHFVVQGENLFMPVVGRQLLYLASFTPSPVLTDSIVFTFIPSGTFVIDSLVAAIDPYFSLLETVSTVSGRRVLVSYELNSTVTTRGATYHHNGDLCLLLLSPARGLLSFNLTNLWYDNSLRSVYTRPGPIMGLAFNQGRLVTGGIRNPIELFDVEPGLQPYSLATYSNEPQVAAVTNGDDVWFSYSSSTRRISSMRLAADSIVLVSSMASLSLEIRKLVFHKGPTSSGNSMLLALGKRTFDVMAVSQDGSLLQVRRYTPANEILDAIVVDSFLLVLTTDRQLFSFRIRSLPSIVFSYSVSTPIQLNHMVVTGPRGTPGGWSHHSVNLAFGGPVMYEIYVQPSDAKPKVYLCGTLPVEVTNTALGYNALFTVGPGGCGMLDLSYEIPKMTEFGGYGGSYIAVHDSIMAASDGSAIHLYHVPGSPTPTEVTDDGSATLPWTAYLHQNYPNPFNPRTTIGFELPRRSFVDLTIFDILGRHVVTLVSGGLSPGVHRAEWDGTDAFGVGVASGVYFYRLTADGICESRKMVFLK